jgi:hypothetical protein
MTTTLTVFLAIRYFLLFAGIFTAEKGKEPQEAQEAQE